ncbi:Mur ligase family protein [Paludisphaera borealis]|uniref:UDP-N-acetylmuramoyl-L-alanyl-D-glutamate--2, 6-diaminopimelate ligase n=1 Tax=Paludisphaera borealis TaxID=1387353 RepID=A0A1U7CZ06_9BACT|nr:UDP-N-acetylmuramyl-tripeptide synthetase [Paludisphaera borealis]APW64123.1 UDP-N-acetylmuramoyl-L-alanyl-D-glutamate--2,6-diaminopimelate ligase [Paludisphaera borealis]MDR3618286.1 UDP-N-acetylmuramyl-tripeptide synthetase [Paludisphaera borealis]
MARWFVDRLPQRGIPSVSLRRLLPEAQFVGCPDWEVSGCTDDHRRLDPGQVFVAVRAPRYDGHGFVREALDRGAAGVVVEQPCPEAGRLQVVVNDARAAHARICHALAGDPSERLITLGVTGTYGKTVTSLMVRSILKAAGLRCGLVGGNGWSDGATTRPLGGSLDHVGPNTAERGARPGFWPGGAAGLASILSYMVDQECEAGVIEVAADAIDSRCFEGVSFQAAVATDLTLPLGFPTEVSLRKRRAKAKLFRKIAPGGAAVVNDDDPNAEILGALNLDARRVSFGVKRPGQVDVSAAIERIDSSGSRFILQGFDRAVPINLQLVGERHISHALAAAALAWSLHIDRDAVVAGLENLANVAGHLEAVDEGQDFDVRIDAAQTATPLAQALAAVRSVAAGRVHLVLSAEGDQDRNTRRALAEVAESAADRVVLTLGNPRSENPDQILDDLLGGFHRPGKVQVEPDRKRAIETALAEARCGDAVLVAGKGRHAYQIFADRVVPFDDFAIARQWLSSRRGRASAWSQRSA